MKSILFEICIEQSYVFFHEMYIFLLNFKNTIENLKFNFLTVICEIGKKRKYTKLFVSIRFTNFV